MLVNFPLHWSAAFSQTKNICLFIEQKKTCFKKDKKHMSGHIKRGVILVSNRDPLGEKAGVFPTFYFMPKGVRLAGLHNWSLNNTDTEKRMGVKKTPKHRKHWSTHASMHFRGKIRVRKRTRRQINISPYGRNRVHRLIRSTITALLLPRKEIHGCSQWDVRWCDY